MKKIHLPSLKFHTIYSAILAVVFLIIAIFVRDIILSAAMLIVVLYVAGNGIIHSKKNEITRDALLEYIIVSAIIIVIVVSVIV